MTALTGTAARRGVLVFAAVAEAATGLALLVAPALVVRLLIGAETAGITGPVARSPASRSSAWASPAGLARRGPAC